MNEPKKTIAEKKTEQKIWSAFVILTLLIIGIIVGAVFYGKTPPEELSRASVNSVKFEPGKDGNYGRAIVETETMVYSLNSRTLTYVIVSPEREMELIEYEDDDTIAIIFDNNDYQLLIPETKVKDISKKYAETYDETIPLITFSESEK